MDKVEALSEHIEKLMVHLKHEAAAKAKAYEAQRSAEKEVELLKKRNSALQRKAAARDKIIVELKEGSKILEDQLRLMDEKYIELRAKLDWTRQHSNKEVGRITKEANKLRAKVMMVSTLGMDGRHGGGGHGLTPGAGSRRGRGSRGSSGRRAPGTAPASGSSSARRGLEASMSVPALPAGLGMDAGELGDPAAGDDDPWGAAKLGGLHAQMQ